MRLEHRGVLNDGRAGWRLTDRPIPVRPRDRLRLVVRAAREPRLRVAARLAAVHVWLDATHAHVLPQIKDAAEGRVEVVDGRERVRADGRQHNEADVRRWRRVVERREERIAAIRVVEKQAGRGSDALERADRRGNQLHRVRAGLPTRILRRPDANERLATRAALDDDLAPSTERVACLRRVDARVWPGVLRAPIRRDVHGHERRLARLAR